MSDFPHEFQETKDNVALILKFVHEKKLLQDKIAAMEAAVSAAVEFVAWMEGDHKDSGRRVYKQLFDTVREYKERQERE